MNAALSYDNDISKEYINIVHNDSKGWITKAEIKNNKYSQWHYKQDELLSQKFKGENVYSSMNTFYKPLRRIECLKELKNHYIDLDTYKTGYNKDQILMHLEADYFGKKIPRPNLIIDSGRGLYLIWNIKSVPGQALPLWKAIEEYLYNELKHFGADRNALDPTRILRVPGSMNSKSSSEVSIIETYEYIYTLREIQAEYLPELKPYEKKKGRPKKIVFIHRERSLYYARLQDIVKLCELRNYDMQGHREIVLFLYRYWLCYFTEDEKKALEDTLGLNDSFVCPLSEREVVRATKSAETVYMSKDKQYKYKNSTLIDILGISKEEQYYLRTIIDPEEVKRRKGIKNKEYYQENKEYYQEYYKEYSREYYNTKLQAKGQKTKRAKMEEIRAEITHLKNNGISNREISNKLNISIETLKRHMRTIANASK